MRALQYLSAQQLAVADVPEHLPGRGEVQISVVFAGLCGTDLHIYHGHMDARVQTPLTFGHEMSGVITAVGEGVEIWSEGDRVTVMPLSWDGTCPACLAGNEHICQNLDFIGIDSPGALQERWNVPQETLVRLPASLALDEAALVEPVAVAVHDVRRSELVPGDRVVVLGGGPIGVLIATVARHEGAEVVVVELDERRRTQIADLGFRTLDPAAQDLTQAVDEWTAGAGADVVFEVSGAAAAVASATSLPKVRGTLVVVAIHPQPRAVDLQRVFWRELRILGARVYTRADFERAVDLVAGGVIPTGALISRIVDLAQTDEAFAALESGEAMKVLVDVSGTGAVR
jgi:2-desacetyl-2-hydroxyethyl bacteriochlorophyllide A dehydrogenase